MHHDGFCFGMAGSIPGRRAGPRPIAGGWGSIILIALCCYLASTLAFGLRFSNLTYRGVVYRGTYSLTKHPAYLSESLTMWMISLLFLAA